MKEKRKRTLFFIIIIVILLLLHFTLTDFYRILLIESILLGIFAMSLDLMLGFTGLVSFGHAAFFGAGGYALGYALLRWGTSIWAALGFAVIVTVTLSIFIGYLSIRAKGIYFAILTLAFAEVIYRIVFYTDFLGGSDGMIGLPRPTLHILEGIQLSITKPFTFFFFTLAYGIIAYGVIWKLTHSSFGKVLEAIRENEERVAFIGYNVKRYKMICFGFSAMFAGLSGAFYSLFKGFADTEQLHFLTSGKVILMTLIGGIRTLIGPVIGAAFITFLETFISRYLEYYLVIVGFAFVLVVIFLPKGLFGSLQDYMEGRGKY